MNSTACDQRRVWGSGLLSSILRRSPALLVLLLLLGASGARADTIYNITFTSGGLTVGTGTLSTDGSCTSCSRGAGLLSFTASFGASPNPNFISLSDFGSSSLYFDPGPLAFEPFSGITNFPAVDTCPCYDLFFNESPGNTWETDLFGTGLYASGTYTIASAVPEPSSVILLATGVLLLGFLGRRKLMTDGQSRSAPGETA